MANIRDLKKDINFVLGDFIETVYEWEQSSGNKKFRGGQCFNRQGYWCF